MARAHHGTPCPSSPERGDGAQPPMIRAALARHHPVRVMKGGTARPRLDHHTPPPEDHVMEWVALMVWIVVALLALPVAAGALSGSIGLGLQAVAAIGGVVFSALFI